MATNGSLPCLQGRVSERRELNMASVPFFKTFSRTLKPRQPHPDPPLLTQGRERIMASIKLYRLVTLFMEVPIG